MKVNKGLDFFNGFSVWAMALGGIIGWGCFMMPGLQFLPDAGPLGSVLGLFIATLFALIICANYSRMVKRYPDAKGSYTYTRLILGEDHAFLAVWCLVLAYVSLIGANSTAIPLMVKYLIGDQLRWGYLYTIAEYDVYFGEIIVSLLAIVILGYIVAFHGKLAKHIWSIAAACLFISVVVMFICVISANGFDFAFSMPFAEDNPPLAQVLRIAIIAPWIYVGFETVTHVVGESKFSSYKIFLYAGLAIISAMLIYIMLVIIAASSAPAGFDSWHSYIISIGDLDDETDVPVFYNVEAVMGHTGRIFLIIATMSALISSALVFYRAGARVIRIVAEHKLLPERFFHVSEEGVPIKAIMLIMAISVISPFIGRTVISWNADVSTLSVAVVYAYISICTFKVEKRFTFRYFLGLLGAVFSILVLVFLLVPNVFSDNTLSMESYFMLAVWSILGIFYYLYIFSKDKDNRFGKSTIMWLIMLLLLFFSTNVWVRLYTEKGLKSKHRITNADIEVAMRISSLIQFTVISVALVILFILFKEVISRQKKADMAALRAQAQDRAKSVFLSNMSHDIRTPMNAIIGMTEVLLRKDLPDNSDEYVMDIKNSSERLLSLINDILDISKIESGKIELENEEYDFNELMKDLSVIFLSRIGNKPIELIYDIAPDVPMVLSGDVRRITQIMTNIIGNACKYTDSGYILVSVTTAKTDDGRIALNISVSDSGRGIKSEDIKKIFTSFSQVDTKKNRDIEGTGLGLAICKNLIGLMGGTLDVKSEYGVGSEFFFTIIQDVVNSNDSVIVKDSDRTLRGAYHLANDMTNRAFLRMIERLDINADAVGGESDIINGNYDYLVTDDNQLAKRIETDDSVNIKVALLQNPMTENYSTEPYEIINKPLTSQSFVMFIEEESYSKASGGKVSLFTAPTAHVLVVDDMPINQKVMIELLKPLNMKIETASNGLEAVNMIYKKSYDVVFMDHMMPVMDGIEAVVEIRGSNIVECRDLPIIALTASATTDAKKRFYESGFSDFISKPIHFNEALIALRKWLPKDKIIESDGFKAGVSSGEDTEEDININIPGVDTKKGIYNSGGVKMFINLLGDVYSIIDERCEEINKYLDEGNISYYTIEVHALKSTLRMIGAMELSDEFYQLEELGKKGDVDAIGELTHGVLDKLKALKRYLEPYSAKDEDAYKEYNAYEVKSLFETLKKAMDDYELVRVDSTIDEIKKYKCSDDMRAAVLKIAKFVSDLDYDKAREVIDGINY